MALIDELNIGNSEHSREVAVIVGNPRVFSVEDGYLLDKQPLAVDRGLKVATELLDRGVMVKLFTALDHNFRTAKFSHSDGSGGGLFCGSGFDGIAKGTDIADLFEDAPLPETSPVIAQVGGVRFSLRRLLARDLISPEAISREVYTTSKAPRITPLLGDCIPVVRDMFPGNSITSNMRVLPEEPIFRRSQIDIDSNPDFLNTVFAMRKEPVAEGCTVIEVPCFAIYGTTFHLAARGRVEFNLQNRVNFLADSPVPRTVLFFFQQDPHFARRVTLPKITEGVLFATHPNAYNLPRGSVRVFAVTARGEVREVSVEGA